MFSSPILAKVVFPRYGYFPVLIFGCVLVGCSNIFFGLSYFIAIEMR